MPTTHPHSLTSNFIISFPGHFNSMIHLAGILHRRGFSITILHTSFNFPHPSRHLNFTFRVINHSNEAEDHFSISNSSQMDLVALLRLLKQRYAEPFRKSLADELRGGGETVCCLISDAIWGKTTEEVGIRRVVLRTGGAASFSAFAAFPLLRDKGYLPLQECRAEEEVTELPPLKVKDLPIIETNEPEELYQIINDMVTGVKSSSGVIWNTFKDLEESSLLNLTNQFQVPLFPIGPFHKHYPELKPKTKTEQKEEHFPILDWLNKQKPRSIVYVSFGSLAATEEKEFHEIASGLRNCGSPFVWVVRPGAEWLNELAREFAENIGDKGKIVKWVNQLEVLEHPAVGVFWTHCGWNSTLESICEGVPMICTPWFTDQLVNARYVVDVWRVGVGLERSKIGKKEIEKVIRDVIVLEKGDMMRERCLKLKERGRVGLSKDGSSFKYLDSLVSHVLSFAS